MTTYIYKTKKGEILEIKQPIGSEPLKKHPETGEEIHRIITNASFSLRGSGYYSTDNK